MQRVLTKELFSNLFTWLILVIAQMADPHRLSHNQIAARGQGPRQGWPQQRRTELTGCIEFDGEMSMVLTES